jgi:hypothetical protein
MKRRRCAGLVCFGSIQERSNLERTARIRGRRHLFKARSSALKTATDVSSWLCPDARWVCPDALCPDALCPDALCPDARDHRELVHLSNWKMGPSPEGLGAAVGAAVGLGGVSGRFVGTPGPTRTNCGVGALATSAGIETAAEG